MKKKILIIDDEPINIQLLSARLKSDYDILSATHGREGVALLKNNPPDLILLDVMMPVMDGFDFFKFLKANKSYASIPVIMLTARALMKDTFEVLGADAFLSKPFNESDLTAKIKILLADKALIVSDNAHAIETITKALNHYGYEVSVVQNEDEMIQKGRDGYYRAVVIHLAVVNREPKNLLSLFETFRHKQPQLIVYSDVRSQGTEGSSTLPIEDLKTKWRQAGVRAFYDSRLTPDSLVKAMEGWMVRSS